MAKTLIPILLTNEKIQNKFWSYVDKTDSCWLWTAAKNETGYGHFCVASGVFIKSHQYSYLAFVGPVPDGMHVLHKCHVRNCVNPSHLKLGTHQDNMNDRKQRRAAHR